MMKTFTLLAALAASAAAHGDHDHDQAPIEGPLKQLWYNTLPGDGGTQVRGFDLRAERAPSDYVTSGRLCLLWHLHLRPYPVPPVPRQRCREV